MPSPASTVVSQMLLEDQTGPEWGTDLLCPQYGGLEWHQQAQGDILFMCYLSFDVKRVPEKLTLSFFIFLFSFPTF